MKKIRTAFGSRVRNFGQKSPSFLLSNQAWKGIFAVIFVAFQNHTYRKPNVCSGSHENRSIFCLKSRDFRPKIPIRSLNFNCHLAKNAFLPSLLMKVRLSKGFVGWRVKGKVATGGLCCSLSFYIAGFRSCFLWRKCCNIGHFELRISTIKRGQNQLFWCFLSSLLTIKAKRTSKPVTFPKKIWKLLRVSWENNRDTTELLAVVTSKLLNVVWHEKKNLSGLCLTNT